MTDIERMKSILSEIEYGFISYDNLHGYDERGNYNHGLELIKTALENQMALEVLINRLVDDEIYQDAVCDEVSDVYVEEADDNWCAINCNLKSPQIECYYKFVERLIEKEQEK